MTLNIETIISSAINTAITASVSGVAMFLSVRYVTRLVDRVDKDKSQDTSASKSPEPPTSRK